MADAYGLSRRTAAAAEFHAASVPDPPRREIWHHDLTGPALVLGSTQRDDVADREACAQLGFDVVRRRSGGGAVLLVPGDVTWFDVIVPAGTDGWSDDVHVTMVWLGGHIVEALRALGAEGARVHDGRMISTEWSRTVCFDGVGPGEVLVGDRKLVGISQRRTRHAARLQCALYHRYDHADLVALLAPPHRPPVDSLAPVATLPADRAQRLPAALAPRLAAPG